MFQQPPEWLRGIIDKHRPVPRLNDIICACSSAGPYITWTPDHVSRHVWRSFLKEAEANEQPVAVFTP